MVEHIRASELENQVGRLARATEEVAAAIRNHKNVQQTTFPIQCPGAKSDQNPLPVVPAIVSSTRMTDPLCPRYRDEQCYEGSKSRAVGLCPYYKK